jgi:A/G-specific adenine glycosylase
MALSSKDLIQFQTKILSWYKEHKRDLPWRRTRDPYKILVSEVMLQQTQVSRVIPQYEKWLKAFPDVGSLANASVAEVLSHWMGLGYNRRALYLKKCAETLVESRKKDKQDFYWPRTERELMKLPGIGKYTARALLCFAFGEEVAVVDTNVRKVILLEVLEGTKGTEKTKEIERIAEKLLPKGRPARNASRLTMAGGARDWNQALMDYASAVLKKEKIPIPKQSKYLGSDRYYRAKILKLLLVEKQIRVDTLGKKIREDFDDSLSNWLENIVTSLEKDGLVMRKNNQLAIYH